MLLSYNWLLRLPCKQLIRVRILVGAPILRSSERPLESTEDRNKFHGVELAAQLQTSFQSSLSLYGKAPSLQVGEEGSSPSASTKFQYPNWQRMQAQTLY